MRIKSFQIENYKSFLSPGWVRLTPSFNVIVGKNNVGKTALVEAVSLRLQHNAHRSIKTTPYENAVLANISKVEVSFEISKQELFEILIDQIQRFTIFVDPANAESNAKTFIDSISEVNILNCIFHAGDVKEAYFEKYGKARFGEQIWFQISRDDPTLKYANRFSSSEENHILPLRLARILRDRIYFFQAERIGLGKSIIGVDPNLSSTASDLARVINLLQGNKYRFEKFNRLISTVLDDVKQISAEPISDNTARILVWTTETDRKDLAIPLDECGTGIGQVLAIVYVVLTSLYPRTIVIDEPQSFLHPGAIRKLFEILRQFPQHQYIFTTHSPTVIAAAAAQSMMLVRKINNESIIEQINMDDTKKLQLYLAEIGTRLSDVFGADNILWVEGQTEEQCYPLILSKISTQPLQGTVILGVLQTGDLEGKDKRRVFEIYQRLSQGRGLLPPAVGFIFDQDGLSAADQEDLIRESRITKEGPSLMRFIPRRMYENYLLNPKAIANVISTIDGFRDTPVTENEIEEWLKTHQWDKDYFKPLPNESKRTSELWRERVDGAKLLDRMFNELSETRVRHESGKVEYGLALTNWLIENAPEELDEIASLLKNTLSQKANVGKAG